MRGTDITSRERSTQGGPVSMAIFGIGITPLINILIVILSNEYIANGRFTQMTFQLLEIYKI